MLLIGAQANTNKVVAASVVYLPAVNLDRPLSKAAWNSSRSLRHFSVLRKLDGQPFPAGAPDKSPAAALDYWNGIWCHAGQRRVRHFIGCSINPASFSGTNSYFPDVSCHFTDDQRCS